MGNKQTYVVETVFQTVNRSSGPANEIAKSMSEAARNAQTLTTVLKGLGAAFIGSRIVGEAKKAFIDYNREIESHKTVLAGMLTMYTGIGIEKTWDRAGASVARFEQMAKASALTTKDIVESASGLTRPLLQAGLSMKEIEEISFSVANASKAFGIGSSVVAMDIEQAITTRVSQRDRFSRNILAQKGVDMTMEKFNALDTKKRVEVLKKALTSDAITAMAKKQGEDTFGGVLSTLEDNFQILASKVGLPLFKAITEEVKEWNTWIDKNQLKLKDIGATVSGAMMKGFGYVKDVFSFIYNNADTLLTIGKVYAGISIGSKLAGGISGTVGGIAGGGAGLLAKLFTRYEGGKKASDSIDPFTGEYSYSPSTKGNRLRGIAQNAGLLGQMAGLGFALGTLMNNATGLSDSIMGVRTVNGQVLDVTDKTTKQYASLVVQMKKFDRSIAESAEFLKGLTGNGARKTQANANLIGQSNFQAQQANLVRDAMRAGLGKDNELNDARERMKLMKSGMFDEDELSKIFANPQFMADKFSRQALASGQRAGEAQKTADTAWESIPEELRKSLDQGRVMQALMQKTLQLMPMTAGGFSQGIILSKEQIEEALKTLRDDDIRGQATTKQTVNITIQQVMAKDPNRWLADMDDMVARRTRNPTRAKRAWKNSPK